MVIEPVSAYRLELLELVPRGPTPASSPAVALELRIYPSRVAVRLWFAGEPVRVLEPGVA